MADDTKSLTLLIDSRKAVAGAAEFAKATDQAGAAATRTAKSVGGLDRSFKTMAMALGGVLSARLLVRGAEGLIGLASAAEEVQSKFNVVFAETTADATRWSQSFGAAVGRSQTEIKKALSGAGDLFKPLGFATADALELSKAMVGLSVDVASFSNAADADVMRDFQSALVGNHETVRKYGVILSESTITQEAFRRGLNRSYKDLSDQQRVLLRLGIIQRGSTDAIGDAIRTGDSYANQQKRLKAALSDTATELGEVFLPAATSALQGVNAALKTSREAVSEWASQYKEGVDIVVQSMQQLQSATDSYDYRAAFEQFGPSAQRGILQAYEQRTGESFGMVTRDVTGMMGGVSVQEWQDPTDKRYARKLMESYGRAIDNRVIPPTVSPTGGTDLDRLLGGNDGASAYTGPGAMYPAAEGHAAYMDNLASQYTTASEARRAAIGEMEQMRAAVEFESQIIGRLSDSHAHAADAILFAARANEVFGEGSAEAVAAIAAYEKSLDRLAGKEKLVSVAQDISRAFGQTFADMVTGAATAKEAFAALGNQIIATMMQKLIVDQMVKSLTVGLGGMFGIAPVMHGGGIVGKDVTGYRQVDPSIFAGAPRLHNGLAADEFPAILQRGESVVPKGGMQAAPKIEFHNHDHTTHGGVDVQPEVQFDGRKMIVGMLLKDKRNRGPISRAERRR